MKSLQIVAGAKKRLLPLTIMAALAALTAPIAAHATPLTLTGNYLEVGISDYGTFGSDGNTSPGILHDPTGTQNFGVNDYLTPGSPHDGFAVNSTQTGFIVNDNNGAGSSFGTTSPTLLTGAAANGYSNAATWTGLYALGTNGLQVTNSYFYNAGDEQIKIVTTLTNLTGADLTNLYFGRSEDPDPDVNTYGTYNSVNTRGDSVTSAANLVSGAGANTGLTIGILNTSTTFASNTSISYNCCSNSDPASVFAGTDSADYITYPTTDNCDCGLQLAWQLNTLAAGATDTITYEYVFGTNQGVVSVPMGGVPEPGTWAMMLMGFGLIGLAVRAHRRADRKLDAMRA